MEEKLLLLSKILKRHNYLVSTDKDCIFIKKDSSNKRPLRNYQFLLVGIAALGIFCLFYLNRIISILILGSTIPILKRISSLSKFETEIENANLIFKEGGLNIRLTNESVFYAMDQIREITFGIEKDDKMSFADLRLKLDDGEEVKLLNLFGEDKRFLEDDIEKVASIFSKIINEKL